MHVKHDQFSDKFNNGEEKNKVADLLRCLAFYVNNLTLWARKLENVFAPTIMYLVQKCNACY